MKTFIDWQDITAKRGKGIEKVKCPSCIDQRSNKADKSLSVNHDLGLAKCHYCEAVSVRDKRTLQTKALPAGMHLWILRVEFLLINYHHMLMMY